MALLLHVVGPQFETQRLLKPGQPELVLGRDADCAVCLPDPQRNVSRRHLAIWNADGTLHFRVLSVVNGVELPFGEAPPGAQGVLPTGQSLKLAHYTLTATPEVAEDTVPPDPWAVFDREETTSGTSATVELRSGVPALTGGFQVPTNPDDDPFGDWGFETTFGPGATAGEALQSDQLGTAADMAGFFRGLGLYSAQVVSLTEGELEAVGRMVRLALSGLFEVHAAAAGVKDELHAQDRTMVATQDHNPLRGAWPLETKLRYLLGGRGAASGYVGPERALKELIADLATHQRATGLASRAAVEGTLREFAPAVLKGKLLGNTNKLFEAARAWDAYSRYHAEQMVNVSQWVQRLLDKYFTEAYAREVARGKHIQRPVD